MRALVCGGRDWTDSQAVYRELDRLHREYAFDIVIEGDARGVDRMAGYWARRKKLGNIRFPVSKEDWLRLGKGAGPLRNRKMLAEGKPDIVIAFPGGIGTANMVSQAHAAGVPVIYAMKVAPSPQPEGIS